MRDWETHKVAGKPLHRVLVPSCLTIFTKASWPSGRQSRRKEEDREYALRGAPPELALA